MTGLQKDLSGRISLWVVICFTVIAYFLATLFYGVENGSYYSQIIIYLLLCVGCVLLSCAGGVNYFERSLVTKKVRPINIAYVLAIGVGLLYFGSFFANIVYYGLEYLGYTSTLPDITITNVGELILNLVFMCALPAFCEEFSVRGGVFASLKKSTNLLKAIILSSLFFAVLHGSATQLVHQFIVGTACAVLLVVGKSLWYPVILHAVNNGIAVVLTYIQSISDIELESITAVEFFTLDTLVPQLVMAVIGAVVAYFAFRAFLRREEREKSEEYADSVVNASIVKRVLAFDQDDNDFCPVNMNERILFFVALGVCIFFVGLDLVGGFLL